MSRIYIGVDPGVSGGFGVVDAECDGEGIPMPPSFPEVWVWVRSRIVRHVQDQSKRISLEEGFTTYCVMEKVTGYIPNKKGGYRQKYTEGGGNAQTGSAMFAFGKSVGALEMALIAGGLVENETLWYVQPQKWQRGLNLRTREKGEEDTSWKNYLKDVASDLFPDTKVTLKIADSLLIAFYCKLKVEGKL